MSCYFRHLQAVFKDANITVSPDNKKIIDQTIHEILGTTYKDCPSTWKALKPILANDIRKTELIEKLKSIAQ
ncbi:hypothetical protein DD509_04210 [Dehalogenimonas alkenigignens]|jgi:hypothetical protein|uniref:Uncharacterized protein n=1 Tax=Dehalogenimonas alkenigignens TaxID=1217799 RepID=A0A0W0GI76_9CHLR|nr:hypothetical protein DEALK_11170 [Dehalogenimonas alkenigignens]PVV84504.1 hypothetical protein DD509_04210 [Dehalogenimonas alkenigignens]